MATRRKKSSSAGIHIKTTAPGSTITIFSMILYLLGVIGAVTVLPLLSYLSFWLCLGGYVLLLIGVLMKGL